MAHIKFSKTGFIEHLYEYHAIGRSAASVQTVINASFISKTHIIIEWKKPRWLIRDISSNGTWLNGQRMAPHRIYHLNINDKVALAGNNDYEFSLCTIDEPVNIAFQANNKSNYLSLGNGILLPNNTNPEVMLYKCPDRLQWFVERINADLNSQSDQTILKDADQINCSNTAWQIFLVHNLEDTTEYNINPAKLSDIEFRFNVSLDEESTNLTLISPSTEINLGERSHHYLLVHLLRHKQHQLNAITNNSSKDHVGWLDCQLASKDLGIDISHLNIQAFRAKKQITDSLPNHQNLSKLIERRRGSIRTGISRFSIYKESTREI